MSDYLAEYLPAVALFASNSIDPNAISRAARRVPRAPKVLMTDDPASNRARAVPSSSGSVVPLWYRKPFLLATLGLRR